MLPEPKTAIVAAMPASGAIAALSASSGPKAERNSRLHSAAVPSSATSRASGRSLASQVRAVAELGRAAADLARRR